MLLSKRGDQDRWMPPSSIFAPRRPRLSPHPDNPDSTKELLLCQQANGSSSAMPPQTRPWQTSYATRSFLAESRKVGSSTPQVGARAFPRGKMWAPIFRRSLQDAGLVIELLSETFLTRPMCLMKLGGAWTLGIPTYPIVVPPLRREDATRQIGNVQMGGLGTDAEISDVFNEFHDRLAQDLSIPTNLPAWSRASGNFKEKLPSKLVTAQLAAATASPPSKVSAVVTAGEPNGDKITISNISVVTGPMGRELHAEATNRDAIEHSAAIKATFYNAEGGIAGTSYGIVNQLGAGRTKTFSINSVPDHARTKVEVDTIF
jgi:hypothetical protein